MPGPEVGWEASSGEDSYRSLNSYGVPLFWLGSYANRHCMQFTPYCCAMQIQPNGMAKIASAPKCCRTLFWSALEIKLHWCSPMWCTLAPVYTATRSWGAINFTSTPPSVCRCQRETVCVSVPVPRIAPESLGFQHRTGVNWVSQQLQYLWQLTFNFLCFYSDRPI